MKRWWAATEGIRFLFPIIIIGIVGLIVILVRG